MTQEEKQLLLKDLCARAQYNVKILVSKGKWVKNNGKAKYYDLVDTVYGVIFYNDEPKIVTPQNFSFLDRKGIINFGGWSVESVKPYLRPMSSMTEGEQKVINRLVYRKDPVRVSPTPVWVINESDVDEYLDFCYSHHLDFRGLIPMGLALEAPEGMYHVANLDVIDIIDDIRYDNDSCNVEVIYKSGKKTSHNIETLKLISSDERQLGTEQDYLIEPNIHVVFYPEGCISTFYFDE